MNCFLKHLILYDIIILPRSCLRSLFFAFFYLHLTYGITIWYPLIPKTLQALLFRLQKRIVRNVCNAPFRAHCMPLFKKESILTIDDIVYLENVKLMYRVTNNLCAKPLAFLFRDNTSTSNYVTRNLNLKVIRHKSTIVNRSFLCKAVLDWQGLDTAVKNSDNKKQFCKRVKRNLLNRY